MVAHSVSYAFVIVISLAIITSKRMTLDVKHRKTRIKLKVRA